MSGPRDDAARRAYRAAGLFALGCLALVAVLWFAPERSLDGALRALDWLAAHNDPAGRAIATTTLAALAALGYAAAWARAASPRRAVRVADGRASIAVEQLERRLRRAALEGHGVQDAAVQIENRHRRGVAVWLRLSVGPRTRLAEAGEGAAERVREVLEDEGVALAGPPAVDLHYDELTLQPRERRSSDAA